MQNSLQTLCSVLALAVTLIGGGAAHAQSAKAATSSAAGTQHTLAPLGEDAPVFARVNGSPIPAATFEATVSQSAREKFYHGKPPENAIDALLREVADRLVERELLLEEAARRGLRPDKKVVAERIAEMEKRFGSSPQWQQDREAVVASLRERLEQDNLLLQLETRTRDIATPGDDKVLAYYKKNPEKFTEPEKMRLSLILIPVAPSAMTAEWKAAEARAGSLRLRIVEGGEDFAALARAHSQDESAGQGGDLGYLHRGMLPDGIQEAIDTMKPGDVSAPTRVLQGFALFKYVGLQPAKHHDFGTVKPRATDLLMRELRDQAWERLIKRLRASAQIELNVARYPALGAPARP